MKHKKFIIVIALCLCLALGAIGLAACDKGGGGNGNGNEVVISDSLIDNIIAAGQKDNIRISGAVLDEKLIDELKDNMASNGVIVPESLFNGMKGMIMSADRNRENSLQIFVFDTAANAVNMQTLILSLQMPEGAENPYMSMDVRVVANTVMIAQQAETTAAFLAAKPDPSALPASLLTFIRQDIKAVFDFKTADFAFSSNLGEAVDADKSFEYYSESLLSGNCGTIVMATYLPSNDALLNELKDDALQHSDFYNISVNKIEGKCHYYTASSKTGLHYTLNEDNASYSVAAFYYETESATVSIPAEYDGKPVTGINNGAFDDCAGLVSVTLPDTIKSIESYAFSDCELPYIIIPASVETINNDAFNNCANLTVYCEATQKPQGWDAYWNDTATPYWFSEAKPLAEGNFWHYVDGEPVKW